MRWPEIAFWLAAQADLVEAQRDALQE